MSEINYTDPLGGHPDNYPDQIFLYCSVMEYWNHAPGLSGYVNTTVQDGYPEECEEYDYLPYDNFSQFAQEHGWDL